MKVNLDLIVRAIWEGKGIKDGSTDLSGLEQATVKMAKAGGAALIAAGAAVVKFSQESLKAFTDFEKGMSEVFTLLPGISGEAMEAMSQDVIAFSQEAGRLSSEVVPAVYQAISAGVPQENVFEFLEIASDAALGGVTDLETAVDGITSVVNAYGAEAISATEASDLMFTAVKLGKTNFEQLSKFMFQVTPVASALGVEFGNVTAALAAMTAQGTPTGVAATQIRSALVELSKASSQTSILFKELTGKSFKEFIAGGGDLQDAFQILEKHASDTGLGINDLFSSVEAGNAALALTGKGAEAFTNALLEMENAAGATAEAADTMGESIAHLEARLAAADEALKLQTGEALAPLKAGWLEARLAVSEYIGESVELRNTVLDSSSALEAFGYEGVALQKALGAIGQGTVLWRESLVGAEEMAYRTDIAVRILNQGFEGSADELGKLVEEQYQAEQSALAMGKATESADAAMMNSVTSYQAAQEAAAAATQVRIDHLRATADGAGEASGAQAMLNDETAAAGVETGIYSEHLEEVARQQAEAAAAAREHAAALGDDFVDAVNTSAEAVGFYGAATDEAGNRTIDAKADQDALNEAMFNAVDSAGGSATALAILGAELGLFSEDAAMAALKTALVQEKIDQLAAAYVNGDISVAQMREELRGFMSEVDTVAEGLLGAAAGQDAMTDATGTLAGELSTASQMAYELGVAIGDIPTEKRFHLSVTSDPLPNMPGGGGGAGTAGGGGFSDQAFFTGGYTGSGNIHEIAGAVHHDEVVIPSSVWRSGSGAISEFANNAVPGGIKQSGGEPVVVHLSIDARGAAAGVGQEIINAGEILSEQLGRDINRMRRGD